MDKAEDFFHQIGSSISGSEKGQLFGKPCYKTKGKAFTCFFEDCMVFKIGGEEHKRAMLLQGAKLFDPSGKGRPMKEWVQVPFEQKGAWKELAIEAFDFVNSGLK